MWWWGDVQAVGLQVPEPAGFVQVGGISESPGAHQKGFHPPPGAKAPACERHEGQGTLSTELLQLLTATPQCCSSAWALDHEAVRVGEQGGPLPARDTDAWKNQAHLSALPPQPTATHTGDESRGLLLCTCPCL